MKEPKKLNHNTIKQELSELIWKALQSLEISVDKNEEVYEQITRPPNPQFGHFAFPCFIISKHLKLAPHKAAPLLAEKIEETPYIEQIQCVGPYINFTLSIAFLGERVAENVLNGSFFERKLIDNLPKTMIEYSQPNTHKELHVGHMRNLCLGNTLIKLHQYCGFEIISSTYPGDVGNHVAKCLWFLKYHAQEEAPEENKGAWLGSLYSRAHIKLEDEKGTPKEDENRQQLTEILSQIENRSGEFYELWVQTRDWSLQLMRDVYQWADIEFDIWYCESDVDIASVNYVRNNMDNGLFIKSEGTIGVDLSEYNLGFCMLIKSDGHGLYATKDLELARKKFEDFHIEKNVYVVDKRQAYHFEQVFKVLELLGFENAKNCFHLKYDFVELPDGAMSSRKGNIVPIMDLIHNMEKTIKTGYLNKYEGEWSETEINETATKIAKGAIKFGMTKIDPLKKVVFDMDEWMKIDGDSGTYLQYTYARIRSLERKLADEINQKHDWTLLNEEVEKQILVKMSEFNDVVVSACLDYKPSALCGYLYDLCKLYNHFYNSFSIKNAENESLKSTRFTLSLSVSQVLLRGFRLLGVPELEKM